MKVGQLASIVDSQLGLYGDKALFIRGPADVEEFQLFVDNDPILECYGYYEAEKEVSGLLVLSQLLVNLDHAGEVLCSCEKIQAGGFQIGFRTESEDFVETINSKELCELTNVLES